MSKAPAPSSDPIPDPFDDTPDAPAIAKPEVPDGTPLPFAWPVKNARIEVLLGFRKDGDRGMVPVWRPGVVLGGDAKEGLDAYLEVTEVDAPFVGRGCALRGAYEARGLKPFALLDPLPWTFRDLRA
jgi:hypothetical protein